MRNISRDPKHLMIGPALGKNRPGSGGVFKPRSISGISQRPVILMKIIPYIYSLSNVIFEVERCSIYNSDPYANDDAERERGNDNAKKNEEKKVCTWSKLCSRDVRRTG